MDDDNIINHAATLENIEDQLIPTQGGHARTDQDSRSPLLFKIISRN